MTFKNLITIASFLALCLSTNQLRADDTPSDDASTAYTECATDANTYAHGALKFFHTQVCLLNVMFPGLAEELLVKMVEKMGMDPDVSALAADGTPTALTETTFLTKTVGGSVAKVVAPSTFASVYDTKAVITVDGMTYATLYWTGSGTSSKGFMIMGGTGFTGTSKSLLYIKWDRTDATAQSVSVLGSRFASTYLASPTTDDALFAEATYNDTTKATTIEFTNLGSQRGATPSTSVFACWKMYSVGTYGGALRVGKTNDSLSASTGHARTSTTQDGIDEMDDWEGTDSKTTADGTGNGTGVQGFAMKYSCSDLNNAGGTGKPFESNEVNHDMSKSEMDAMFTVN